MTNALLEVPRRTSPDTQLVRAVRRILDDAAAVDPASSCARFNSAF